MLTIKVINGVKHTSGILTFDSLATCFEDKLLKSNTLIMLGNSVDKAEC